MIREVLVGSSVLQAPRAEQVGGSGLQDDKKTVKPVIIELTMKYKYFPNFGDCHTKNKEGRDSIECALEVFTVFKCAF